MLLSNQISSRYPVKGDGLIIGAGGSRNAQIVAAMEAKKVINLQKMKNPSKYLIKKYGHVELEEAHPSGVAKPKLIIKSKKDKSNKVSVKRIEINGVLYFKDPVTNKLYDPKTSEEVGTWNSRTKTIIPYVDEYEDEEEDEEEEKEDTELQDLYSEYLRLHRQKFTTQIRKKLEDIRDKISVIVRPKLEKELEKGYFTQGNYIDEDEEMITQKIEFKLIQPKKRYRIGHLTILPVKKSGPESVSPN